MADSSRKGRVRPVGSKLSKEDAREILEPLGIEYLCSGIQPKYDVELLDLDIFDFDIGDEEKLREYVGRSNPDVVGITVSSPMTYEARKITTPKT